MLYCLREKCLRSISLLIIFAFVLAGPLNVLGQFTQGNLSVLQTGTGSALNSAAAQLSIVELNLSGVVTYSLALPGSGPTAITNSGSATSEGQMVASAERDRLVVAGYNAPVGTAAIASSTSAAAPRELCAISSSGSISAPITSSTFYSGNNIRSGTVSGLNYYAGGSGVSATSGATYFNTPVTLTSPGLNTRVIQIFNGLLYFSSGASPSVGLNLMSGGLPTTCCQPTSLIISGTVGSPYGFSVSPDGNTIYVADDVAGIHKFTRSGSTYTAAYQVNNTPSRGIAVDYSGASPIIYATTAVSPAPNGIIKIIDAGAGSASSPVATAPAGTFYRSVQFSPYCGATVSLLGASTTCSGSTAQLVFKGNPTGVVAYNINGTPYTTTIGANGYDTVTTPVITANSTVNLVSITTQACATTPITGTVSINLFPVATIPTIGQDGPLCAGANLHLNATITASAGPYNYVWTGPSGYSVTTSGSAALTNSATVTAIPALPATPVYSLAVTDANGCVVRSTVATTVNPLPTAFPVFGTGSYCAGAPGVDVQLSNSELGVDYQLYNTLGTVGAVKPGNGSVIDFGNQPAGVYTVSAVNTTTGCTNSMSGAASVSVNPLPAVITGTLTVCPLNSTTLSDATTPGTWTSGTTSVATIGAGTGVVTGVSAGTSIITYTLPTTCRTTAVVTVYPLPVPISGGSSVCIGLSVTLTDGSAGGTWNSSNTGVATISGGGAITTGTTGTTTISYTLPTGCMITEILTVNPLPAAIAGSTNVCVASTITLSDADAGGTWSSGTAAVATVGSLSGGVTGVSQGTTLITYTLPTTCMITTQVTVNPLPAGITGALNACVGFTSALSDVTPGGNWTSSNTTNATIGSGTGLVTGLVAGTSNISYILTATGCLKASTFTVNPLPVTISGPATVCAGSTTNYSDASGGGIWTSSNPGIATIGSVSGNLVAIMSGTTNVTYTIGGGCYIATTITVNPLPAAITGTMNVCEGLTRSLTDGTTGGTWSSSATGLASVDGSGNVLGVSAGSLYISYTLPNGCYTTTTFTVNPLPGPINGPSTLCAGSSATLTDAATSGTWTSSSTSFVSINATSGFTSGIMSGTSTITYQLATGCLITKGITVNPLPAAITGNAPICVGATETLSDATPSGTWSSSTLSYATVGSSTGVVTGTGAGMPVITYTLPTSCFTTAVVTVNPIPLAISGAMAICVGATTALSDVPAGGTWSSGAVGTASVVTTSGVVTGVSAGTATITYTSLAGCSNTGIVTVNPLPPAITGVLEICPGITTSLTDVVTGGTWSSVSPSVATVGPTGIVTSIAAGTAVISYSPPTGCGTYVTVTVDPLPAPISGNTSVCLGFTSTLSDASTGGTWSSSASAVAPVAISSGVVGGSALGTAKITYTLPTNCFITTVVTVNPMPAPITGTAMVCAGAITILNDATAGGTWGSGAPDTAIVTSTTGVVSGIAAGTAGITYMLPTGCGSSVIVTVNPLPAAITGTLNVCAGLTTALSDASVGGTWSSFSGTIASVGASSGLVTGNLAGTTLITYTLPTGCITTATVTVNPLPPAISGNVPLCVGSTIILSDVGGGTWSTEFTGIISVSLTGGVVTGYNAGTALVSYTLSTGCVNTTIVTVNPLPASIGGTAEVCAGLTALLTDATPGGVWSSGNPGIATVGSGSGIVTGVAGGSVVITYTVASTGCFTTVVFSVTPPPPAITGVAGICEGQNTSLSDLAAGGTWSSGSPSVATVGATGIVSGISAGTSNITYTIGSGCVSIKTVTVNPLPAAISGSATICVGATTTLSDALPGGTWLSSNTAAAIIGTASGVVTAIAPGTSAVTYTLPTGCAISVVVTVNPLPNAILGVVPVCVGSSVSLADLATGGLWSIDPSTPGVASVTPSGGVVTGIAAGTTIITYALPTSCFVTSVLTVNPLPLTITGTTNVCVGSTATLTDASPGGTWSSSNTSFATVGVTTGIVNGISQGTPLITYKLPTGCITTIAFIVNPLPDPISGNRSVCIGSTSSLSDVATGGTWSMSALSTVGSVDAVSGIVSGITLGTAVVTYTLPTGCMATTIITVNPYPTAILDDTIAVCQGFNIALRDTTAGGTWSSANTIIASVTGAGIVTGVSAGTVNISYTLSTGCGVAAVVTVNPLFPITGGDAICEGYTSLLGDLATGGRWSSSDIGVATIDSATGLVTGLTSGATIISYYLNTGCLITRPVTVNPVPSNYGVVGGGAYCAGGAGEPIGLTGSDTGVVYRLIYSTSSVATHAGTDSAFTFGQFLLPGGYTVLATNTITGCNSMMTGTATITVNPVVVPAVLINALSGITVCEGSTASFSAITFNGGSAPLYQWAVNGVNTGTGVGYSYIPNNGDIVTLKVTSNAVCAQPDTAVASLTMSTATLLMPSVSIAVSPGDSVCPGAPVTFTPFPTYGGLVPGYRWMVNGILAATTSTYTYFPTDGDNIFCDMHADITCAAVNPVHSNNIVMSVPPIEIPAVSVAAYPGTTIVAGETVTFVASALFTGLSLTYQWEINSHPVFGAVNDTFISSTLNNRDVVRCMVTGYSVCGFAARISDSLVIDSVTTKVQGMYGAGDIRLMPNPNNGAFTITGTLGADDVSIEITDMLGQVMYKKALPPQNGKMSEQIQLSSALANGMYILQLRSGAVSKDMHFVVGK